MRLKFGNLIINVLGYFFIWNCRRELQRKARGAVMPDADLLVARIRDHTQQVFDMSVMALPEPKARVIYAYCSLVLAAFREFRAETGDVVGAYAFARAVFQRTLERPWRWLPKIWLWLARDPVGFLSRWSLARLLQRSYGTSMEFAEEKTDGAVTLVVRRCAYHQFFVDHGEPTLTPVLCVFDRIWLDVIDRSTRPIRTELPSTISTGGDSCRFRFIRDHDKQVVEPVDVVMVQLQKPPYQIGYRSRQE
ncbi:MAG TPA: L-2-amino-thiazoline-4-carboxylic acid hydrolase [Blastocatellia bacterium]|nr:L-2-amino-thiazoline-4-carboxylic acid hydrolase [Blastocatellia bacterium]